MSDTLAVFFAQLTSAAASTAAGSPDAANTPAQPWWLTWAFPLLFAGLIYFAFLRPQMQATKQKEQTVKTAKTGDKIVTSSGIHGVITNVKEATVIVKVADNVKLEIEKSHIDKITRSDSGGSDSDNPAVTAKA
jgi:preprotein translocase subunit YajC